MKKIYSLFLLMLFAIVGAGQAWAKEYKAEAYVAYSDLCIGDILHFGATIKNDDFADCFIDYFSSYEKFEDGLSATTQYYSYESFVVNEAIFITEKTGENFYHGEKVYKVVDKEVYHGDNYDEYYFSIVPCVEAKCSVSGLSGTDYYGTFYSDKAWIVPEGVSAYTVSNNLLLNEIATEGEAVAARTAVILKGNTYNDYVAISNSTQSPQEENLLCGVLVDTPIPAEPNVKYYKLSYNTNHENLGFYWDGSTNDEGATINAKAHKAYLRVEGNSGSSNYLALRFDDTITGVDAVSVENNSQNIYDLWGKHTNNQNGIVIMDGKKMFVK